MKKLLSLLSFLTISGATMPMVVAASPYQQTNNLQTLKRNKRENINLEKENNLSKLSNEKTPELKVSYEIEDYFSNLYNIINFLQNNGNVRLINPEITGGYSAPNVFFVNENFNNQYFLMPINIENNRRISLVFRSTDFYLQGFIGHPTNNNQTLNVYYYFNDATIRIISETTREEEIPFGSNYTGSNGLQANLQAPIRWVGIVDSFHQLANYGENPSYVDSNTLRAALLRVILATAESIRFREVRNNIILNHDNDSSTSNWGWYFNNFLRNWDHFSKEALEYLLLFGTLIGFANLNNINVFSKTLSNNFKSCDRQAKDLNSNKYCFNIPEKIVYFRDDHDVSKHYAEYSKEKDDVFYDFSEVEIGDIDPLNYNKIEFFGEQLTKVSWGNDAYYGTKINESKLGKNFKEYIFNINIRDFSEEKYKEVAKITLSDKCERDGLAWMCHTQKAGITFYRKQSTKKWHIQIISYRWIRSGDTSSGGANWIWIGKGIKLS